MKVYIICFDNETIAYPKVFLDEASAEERLRIMQDEMDAEADRYQRKSYSQWYSVEEMETPVSTKFQGMLSFGSPLTEFKDIILRDGAFEDEEPRKYKYRVTVEEVESSASEAPSEPEAKE